MIDPKQDYYENEYTAGYTQDRYDYLDRFMQQDEDLQDHQNPDDPFRLELGGQG